MPSPESAARPPRRRPQDRTRRPACPISRPDIRQTGDTTSPGRKSEAFQLLLSDLLRRSRLSSGLRETTRWPSPVASSLMEAGSAPQ